MSKTNIRPSVGPKENRLGQPKTDKAKTKGEPKLKEVKVKTKAPKTEKATSRSQATLWSTTEVSTTSDVHKKRVTDLSTQARVIYDTLLDKGPMTREALISAITPELKTKQSPEKIFSFYRGKLLNGKLIEFKLPEEK